MKNIVLILLSLCSLSLYGQKEKKVSDPKMDEMLKGLLSFSVPLITVEELKKLGTGKVLLLDAREKVEYDLSHLPGAIHIGYNDFNMMQLASVPKNTKIVVYCSVGYRSEKIGEQLEAQGFTDVNNLYGSIFEWVNQGNKVFDAAGKETTKVHTYSEKWGKWLRKGQRVY
jgi:rhodanese-related sulfurtransferase